MRDDDSPAISQSLEAEARFLRDLVRSVMWRTLFHGGVASLNNMHQLRIVVS
jgi:hypothetical protein